VSLSPYEQGRYRDLSQFRTKVGFRVHLVKVEHDLQRTSVHEHAHPPVSARCAKFEPSDPNDAANTCRGRIPDKGEVGGSSPLRSTINPQCLCGHSRFCLSPEFPAKPFVNDLSTSGIAICRPRRHRRHHNLALGFTDCLNFLLTATAPRHSRNGKNINVHSRHIGLWKSSVQNQRSQIRGVTVIDTCVIWTIVRLIRDR
jgi:hypothetical protein